MPDAKEAQLAVATTLAAAGDALDAADPMAGAAVDATLPASIRNAGSEAVPSAGARWRTVGLLGEGGMGRVDEVWDADLMRAVAVKRLRPAHAGDPSLVRQFLWEARVTASLDHPNIPSVHDLGHDAGGDVHFAMARVGGVSLADVIARLRDGDRETQERFPLPRRLRLFVQVAQAIAFAHRRGVLHRDLKPANVMVGAHGEVRVMDWGLALPLPTADEALRALVPDGIEGATRSAGTPRYMSPEQARGEPLDERSDVWALGVLLYELAALALPVAGDSVSSVLEAIAAGRVRPLRDAWPAAPPSLTAVVERAMAREARNRYPSASALAEDIERVLDGHTPSAESVSLVRRATRFYLARDPAMSRLRVWELDAWAFASFLVGAAGGVLAARWIGRWWWALVVGGLATATPPTVHWLRELGRRRARRRE